LAAYTGDSAYYDAAVGHLRLLSEAMRQYPQAFGESLSATDALVSGYDEVALVGRPEDTQTTALLEVLRDSYRPNVISALAPDNVDSEAAVPLLAYRVKREDKATVYVCRNFACAMPVTTAEAMRGLLAKSGVDGS
jgi:uncharacterized protein YyaL (SSP411 family)